MDLRALGMGLAFAFMWSSAFTSARIIVAHAPPLGISALRFLIAGTLAVALARAQGQSWRLTTSQARLTVVFGICQNALYLGLFFVAMQTIEASLAAIIASTMPLLVAVASWAVLGERMRALGVVGLLAGFTGVALIMGSRLQAGGADPVGIGLCLVGVLALTFATLSVRGASSGGNVLMIVGLQMLVGAAVLMPASLLLEAWRIDWSLGFVLAFAYTVIVPGLIATMVWFLLVRRIGAVKAATFHFLNPFFGVAVAALLLGERLGPLDAVGVVIIMAGILAVQLSRQASSAQKDQPRG
ncbi:DMT family transporter [Tropicimonas isoalkanivorans]|uniref:Threonine/homoserine efflux transporter RhtA n=1 Tax=Tropicimonas isoalkanivorans TaxID=441112 RepID=A0A1I1LUS4_9RHOB|nr:DMT family transporter [Tropicimonas isoalkanivorans]SFC76884.1 Threonine/homoserine efflux transporter RhtA [Tropicimonas isoalkanivorans]